VLVQVFSSLYFRNISVFYAGSYGQIARLEKETFLRDRTLYKSTVCPTECVVHRNGHMDSQIQCRDPDLGRQALMFILNSHNK
jgi:hypothetical protein